MINIDIQRALNHDNKFSESLCFTIIQILCENNTQFINHFELFVSNSFQQMFTPAILAKYYAESKY